MSRFSKACLIIALLIAATIARSEGIYNPTAGGWFSFTGGVGGSSGGISNSGAAVPASTGKILLVDAVSFILKVDAVSKICRAGGC